MLVKYLFCLLNSIYEKHCKYKFPKVSCTYGHYGKQDRVHRIM